MAVEAQCIFTEDALRSSDEKIASAGTFPFSRGAKGSFGCNLQ